MTQKKIQAAKSKKKVEDNLFNLLEKMLKYL